ncbi:hypothetical protein [Nocardia terpenica]|uniref:Uncharacterized protein n=1 Tax=Nocardia terpenica TaxID=455432 RepID=A0A6G9Z103_9NOCA|nr:hypothetical protein [Nocardia terpenica]QIS19152.1 hypothetical protein F6W96_13480 [Nocardia terpenica]
MSVGVHTKSPGPHGKSRRRKRAVALLLAMLVLWPVPRASAQPPAAPAAPAGEVTLGFPALGLGAAPRPGARSPRSARWESLARNAAHAPHTR